MKIIYGKLTIIPGTERQVLIGKRKNIEIKTVCKCGNIKYLNFSRLKNGTTKSCGCSHYEKITTHGHSYTGTYGSWKAMIQRCQNPNSKYFYHYGGRGIKICRRWKKFENFLADMGERQEGMTLYRINGNKGYSKENCRWATKKEQQMRRSLVWGGGNLGTLSRGAACWMCWLDGCMLTGRRG